MAGRPPDDLIEGFVEDTHYLNTAQLSDKYERAQSTIRDWKSWCNGNDFIVGHGRTSKIAYTNRKNVNRLSNEDIFNLIKYASGQKDEDRPEQSEISLEINEDLPIALAFPGDLHIGVEGVAYEEMEADFKALGAAEGLYAIGMGDYAHNPKLKLGGRSTNLYKMVMPDCEGQYRGVEFILGYIPEWLGLITGCHDDWDFQVSGDRRIENLCEKLDTANLWHGAVIHIALGETKYLTDYDILARHRYKFESSMNVSNVHRQAFNQLYPADVIAIAHKHFPMQEKRPRWMGRKDVVNVRGGSYYRWDDFGQKIGGYEGIAGVPIVLLYPDEKRAVPFYGRDMNKALRFLASERKAYMEEETATLQ